MKRTIFSKHDKHLFLSHPEMTLNKSKGKKKNKNKHIKEYYTTPDLPQTPPTTTFHNLSTDNSLNTISFLGSGLKFIPKPSETTNSEIMTAVSELNRRVQLHWIHSHRVSTSLHRDLPYISKGTIPSQLSIPPTLHSILSIFNSNIRSYTNEFPTNNHKSLLPKELREIQQKGHIVFASADKNLGLVALDTMKYHQLIINHLSNGPYTLYSHSLSTLIQNLSNKIGLLQAQIPRLIRVDPQEHDTMMNFGTNLPKFHGLPKIHKTGPLSIRPIVGATNWITTNISKLVAHYLNIYLDYVRPRSIIRDSKQFVRQGERLKVPSNAILFTMDASSLYTNIHIDLLRSATKQFIEKIPGSQENPARAIDAMIDFICSNNYFEYFNHIFHQTDGIAMGTNCAVHLANIYCLELFDYRFKTNKNILFFRRFIDDIFGIWLGSHDDLLSFVNEANTWVPNLTWNLLTGEELPFLDLKISLSGDRLIFKTHQKSMNTYTYLPPFSCHPKATFRGFIKGELIRYLRTNSRQSDYLAMKAIFRRRLLARGYPHRFITSIFQKVLWIHRHNHLQDRPKTQTTTIIPMCLRYSYRKQLSTLGRHTHALNLQLKQKLKVDCRVVMAYKKSRNVAQLLIRSALTPQQQQFIFNHNPS